MHQHRCSLENMSASEERLQRGRLDSDLVLSKFFLQTAMLDGHAAVMSKENIYQRKEKVRLSENV